MFKKVFVGLAIAILASVVYVQRLENSNLQVFVGNISASLEVANSFVVKIREENLELKRRMEAVEKKVSVLQMVASWYGPGFHGKTAADGSTYDQFAFTCAHKTLPFGTILVVQGPNGRRVPVVVTDRGPFIAGRDIDLSYATAELLGLLKRGVGGVTVYKIAI